jgi:hypothetical protein
MATMLLGICSRLYARTISFARSDLAAEAVPAANNQKDRPENQSERGQEEGNETHSPVQQLAEEAATVSNHHGDRIHNLSCQPMTTSFDSSTRDAITTLLQTSHNAQYLQVLSYSTALRLQFTADTLHTYEQFARQISEMAETGETIAMLAQIQRQGMMSVGDHMEFNMAVGRYIGSVGELTEVVARGRV